MLQESHVWPKFAYRYVADQSRGGEFIDLHKGIATNAQYKEHWLCAPCEAILCTHENEAAQFCRAIDRQPTEPQEHGDWLLPFLTSISWRSALFDLERGRIRPDEKLIEAMKRWRRYLLRRVPHVGLYAQHLILVVDHQTAGHKVLGGQVFPRNGLVMSQIGPLFIAGLYDVRGHGRHDLGNWQQTRVSTTPGVIRPITSWRVGSDITLEYLRLLCKRFARMGGQLKEMSTVQDGIVYFPRQRRKKKR
jgi:hypothetical protein